MALRLDEWSLVLENPDGSIQEDFKLDGYDVNDLSDLLTIISWMLRQFKDHAKKEED